MICLDSDFIVDLIKRKHNAVFKFHELKGEIIVSTEVNYFEVLYGAVIKKQISQRELDTIKNFFDFIPNMPLDHPSAHNTAEIAAHLEKTGQTIGLSDIMIAGICLANNCPLLTKNIRHFSRIKRLKVETY